MNENCLNPLLKYFVMVLVVKGFVISLAQTISFILHGRYIFSQSSRFHLMIYILPSFIIAVLLNIPKWLELEFDRNPETGEILDYVTTELRHNPDYIFYYTHFTR